VRFSETEIFLVWWTAHWGRFWKINSSIKDFKYIYRKLAAFGRYFCCILYFCFSLGNLGFVVWTRDII